MKANVCFFLGKKKPIFVASIIEGREANYFVVFIIE